LPWRNRAILHHRYHQNLVRKNWTRSLGESFSRHSCLSRGPNTSCRKYIGYPGLVAGISAGDDYFVLRRFDRLHCRVLLKLQDDVAVLEERLDALDASLSMREAPDFHNGRLRHDQAERRELLDTITQKLNDYGKSRPKAVALPVFSLLTARVHQDQLLCRYIALKAREPSPRTNTRNLALWLSNREGAIDQDEARFVQAGDLITVSKSPKSPLRRLFEQHILAPTAGLFGLIPTKLSDEESSSGLKTSVRGDDAHVDVFAAISVFSAALVMLIVPLWILAIISSTMRKLAVITAFSIAFLALMNWGTLGRPFEILAATAGYVPSSIHSVSRTCCRR